MVIKKLVNLIAIASSYYLSRLTKKTIHWGKPIALSVEPTTACNLRCPECPSGLRSFTRPTGNVDLDFYKKTIDQVKSHLYYLTLYFQGEPMIHPNFYEMASYASERGIFTATSTNGHFLTHKNSEKLVRSGLRKLIVSIDGTTQETYKKYRINGDLAKVTNGIRTLTEEKKKQSSKYPKVIIQFIVFNHNEHQLQDVKKLGKELGVDNVVIKSAQIYDYEKGSHRIPENQKMSRYKKVEGNKYKIKNKLYNHCWRMWSSSVITWDGKVIPCCFDKDADHRLGELSGKDFENIWKGKRYHQFRKAVQKDRSQINICKNCSEGTKVWL